MARRRSLTRFRAFVVSVVGGVQVPGVAALAHFLGNWPLAVGGATLISLPFLYGLRRPFEDRPKSRLYLYGGLWPFFAWWVACLVFAALAPLALLVAWTLRLPSDGTLAAAGSLAMLGGVLATRRHPRLVTRELVVDGLPPELDGYRIGQISDIHCGSYTPPARVARWVDRLNATRPDLIAVTGDLISSGDHHVEAVAGALGGLSARDGVFACMGNHDYFTDADVAAALERRGITVLRNRGVTLPHLHVAGVDDTWSRRDDVQAALAGRPDGVFTLLLAHDPNLFPQAVEAGVDLTLSGHTHGGQLAVPWLNRRLSLARVITPFAAGLYRIGRSLLYVNVGAGTTGPPVRLGARAELTLLVLKKALDSCTDRI
jgi:predicted MPP superfamily phosphohydrolase